MNAGEEVDEEVAGYAGPIVPVAAPPEEPLRIEGTRRRVAEKAIPSDGLRGSVRRDRVLPRPDRRIAVVGGLDQVHPPDGAGPVQLPRLVVEHGTGMLAAHLQDPSGSPLRIDHPSSFVNVVHHRLLLIDRFARLHRVDGDPGVPVIGGADQDGVDVRAVQDLPIVARRGDLGAEHLARADQPPVVAVGGGHELGGGHFQGRFRVDEPDDAHPDRGDPDRVARRHGLRCPGRQPVLGACVEGGRCDADRQSGSGRLTEKIPARGLLS
jgi:hypothetical protein